MGLEQHTLLVGNLSLEKRDSDLGAGRESINKTTAL